MTLLNLAHSCVTDGVNGPGRRFTVWVQGCPHRCPGCFNPGLCPQVPRRLVTPEALVADVAAAGPLDGLTLSGGEPFDQAAALAEFLDAVAAAALPVIAFTGYTVEELRAGPSRWSCLLARVDLLVDGRYREDLSAAAKPLAGSANQRLLALTAVGDELLKLAESAVGGVQVQITADGEVLISGFPSAGLLRQLRSGLYKD